MKVKRKWLIVCACWLYFLAAIFLYNRGVAWVNTFELLLELAVLLAISVWYVVDRLQYRHGKAPRTGNWVVGPSGIYRRRDDEECESRSHSGGAAESNPPK
jgi:hypothetical protein